MYLLKCLLMFIGQFLSGYGQHSLTEMIPRVWGLVGWGIWEGGIRTGLEVITGCSSLSREEGSEKCYDCAGVRCYGHCHCHW